MKPSELRDFYQKNYLNGLSKVNLVGNFEESYVLELVERLKPMATKSTSNFETNIQNKAGKTHIERKDAMQTAIRIGKILFNKKHTDFIEFQVLNTILGDYFGSRLMTNIREEKGYTYGIGSMVAEYKNFGYFMIGTEVAKEFVDSTLEEVQKRNHQTSNRIGT